MVRAFTGFVGSALVIQTIHHHFSRLQQLVTYTEVSFSVFLD